MSSPAAPPSTMAAPFAHPEPWMGPSLPGAVSPPRFPLPTRAHDGAHAQHEASAATGTAEQHQHSAVRKCESTSRGQNVQWGAMHVPRCSQSRAWGKGLGFSSELWHGAVKPISIVLCPGDQGLTSSFQSSDLSQ